MTQTLARPGTYMNTVPARVSDRVQMAQTVGYRDHGGVRLYRYDLVSVAEAREEFPDARRPSPSSATRPARSAGSPRASCASASAATLGDAPA
jgi:hypothetical protein